MADMLKYEDYLSGKGRIAVVGLGYVGLPLAVALSEDFAVLGFDISSERVAELEKGHDRTREVDGAALAGCDVEFSCDPASLKQCSLLLVAVPTPIDEYRTPDLRPITSASRMVGENLAEGAVVVYESTVYPGLTEDVCGPILEEASGMERGHGFWLGYSPERINPGDHEHTITTITKVVAGENEDVAELVSRVYGKIVTAGIHKASSIKVAEAAKVIENTQRDLNIALMNELAVIFDRLGIDTLDVIEAASTKWNFLPFKPGLVGGHCIGVDPYYLTFKAESLGFHPETILAGRRINDSMGKFLAETTVKRLIRGGRPVKDARVGVLGVTFKENVPDLRNTKVVDVVRELGEYGVEVLVHDPMADPGEAREEYGLELVDLDRFKDLEAMVLAVGHQAYAELPLDEIRSWFHGEHDPVVVDVKGFFDRELMARAGFDLWRL